MHHAALPAELRGARLRRRRLRRLLRRLRDGFACSAAGTCACVPQCDGRACGDDGCGGACGACPDGQVCSGGACTCVPACTGKVCGDDTCGGSCGSCAPPATCDGAGQCQCVPDCAGRRCGPDGCGGTCGTCRAGLICNTQQGTCGNMCTPSCAGRACGDDGCGGTCGACPGGQSCTTAGQCSCVPSCPGRACGPDGCGGTCGACAPGLACSTAGQCGCTRDYSGRVCGDDGRGGTCGSCPDGGTCNLAGQCGCAPSCAGRACGDDGCGGTCGTCAAGQSCTNDQCVWPQRSFAADVWPIFQQTRCADGMCHAAARPGGASLLLAGRGMGLELEASVFLRLRLVQRTYLMGELASRYRTGRAGDTQLDAAAFARLGWFATEWLDLFFEWTGRATADHYDLTRMRYQLGANWLLCPWVELSPAAVFEEDVESGLQSTVFLQLHVFY